VNISRHVRRERWFAGQFKDMPGGYAGACDWPDAPVNAATLAQVARGERRLNFAVALWLASVNDRADLFAAMAALIDETPSAGDLAKLGHRDVYASATLAETIDAALDDGVVSSADLHDMRRAAADNLHNATTIAARLERLQTGPVEG